MSPHLHLPLPPPLHRLHPWKRPLEVVWEEEEKEEEEEEKKAEEMGRVFSRCIPELFLSPSRVLFFCFLYS